MPAKESSGPTRGNSYPWYAPRFWNGMSVRPFFQLLQENRFRIHPLRWPMAVLGTGCAFFNSTMNRLQRAGYGKRIAATSLIDPPVFIVGHWRSGTTLMHELLSLDDRLAFPTNFDAFAPAHSLVSRPLFQPVLNLLLPGRRPMDNMSVHAGSPQEDDFALVSMGAPTPYRRIAFPNHESDDHRLLDDNNLSAEQETELRDALQYFFRALTIQYQKRLVLKSPPHTGRIAMLAKWFPGARFVHMARDPMKIVPSTMRLWKLLDQFQGFQLAKYSDEQLRDYVFDCQQKMYDRYFVARGTLPENQLVEIRFEDLVENPVETVAGVYRKLELGNCDSVLPEVENYFQAKTYRKNTHHLDDDLASSIRAHWSGYMREFDYGS